MSQESLISIKKTGRSIETKMEKRKGYNIKGRTSHYIKQPTERVLVLLTQRRNLFRFLERRPISGKKRKRKSHRTKRTKNSTGMGQPLRSWENFRIATRKERNPFPHGEGGET